MTAETGSQAARVLREVVGPYFGDFGGRFVPEALIAALDDLSAAWEKAKGDPEFTRRLAALHRDYTGRPSPITEVPQFAAQDRKSTRLNSSHVSSSYAVFCLNKKN